MKHRFRNIVLNHYTSASNMNGILVDVKTSNRRENGRSVGDDVTTNAIGEENGPKKVPLLAELVYGSYNEKRSKLILQHDHGVGSPCSKCKKCKRGLELHFWRKICKNCGCNLEDHNIQVNESVHETIVYNLLNMTDDLSSIEVDSDDEQLLTHPILKEFFKKKKINKNGGERTTKSSNELENKNKSTQSSSLLLKTDGVSSDAVNIEFSSDGGVLQADAPDNCDEDVGDEQERQATERLRHGDEQERQATERLRQQYLMRQIPPQDFDPSYCHELDAFEKKEHKTFCTQVQEKAVGKSVTKFHNFEHELKCANCEEVIDRHSPYKFAERLPNQLYHPECFKCYHCKESLVGNIYFAHANNIYCGRHYGQLFKSRCAGCDELIFAKVYTNAEEVNWHTKHFCCFKCDYPLADKLYIMISRQPYCVPCYHDDIADLCNSCGKPIEAGTERIHFNEFNWHVKESCFACLKCRKSLIDLPFVCIDDEIFCSEICAEL